MSTTPNLHFIDLERTFRELSLNETEQDALLVDDVLSTGSPLTWDNVLAEHRLIILSEAGAGKTEELRQQARALRGQGRCAFFLRLEHVADTIEVAFDVGTFDQFQAWLASEDEGWLLLDSVDESRLKSPREFDRAIRRLNALLASAFDRIHIVITGRTDAWRPRTDLALCRDKLPFSGLTVVSELGDGVDAESIASAASPDGSTSGAPRRGTEPFRIVALCDLSREQVKRFANARGIVDLQSFLNAIERTDAWMFTTRPQDLEELIAYWNDNQALGSRLELMAHSVERRLVERDQDRAEQRPLSADQAKKGVMRLAAAATLMRQQTFRVPDGGSQGTGVAVRSILPDWDETDQAALLSRPIFDEEIYGTVRFHHRSVREYLTAIWFAELLKHETSRRSIESLFFKRQYGQKIVAPILRPILPWLVLFDEKIRDRVSELAPDIFLEGGDPGQLPLLLQQQILTNICDLLANDRMHHRSTEDFDAAQRFACPALAPTIRNLMHTYVQHEDVMCFLLRMVWTGQLKDCLPEVMQEALSNQTRHIRRLYAFRALQAIDSCGATQQVREHFLAEGEPLDRRWIAELVSVLPPTSDGVVWLMAILAKAAPKERYSYDELGRCVEQFVATLELALLPTLIHSLNTLLNTQPVIERGLCEISERFAWLLGPACKAIEPLMDARHPAMLDTEVLDTLEKLSMAKLYSFDDMDEIKTTLSEQVSDWTELNWTLFWHDIGRSRAALWRKSTQKLTHFWQTQSRPLWHFDLDDFDRSVNEIEQQPLVDDRLVALSVAFHLYKVAGRPRHWLTHLKKAASHHGELAKVLQSCLHPPPLSESEKALTRREAEWARRDKARERQTAKYHDDWKGRLSQDLTLLRQDLADSPASIPQAIRYLFQELRKQSNSGSRWTEYSWKTLIPRFGDAVAMYYRDFLVAFWRHYQPLLHSEGAPFGQTPHSVIFGLAGLEIQAHETPEWIEQLEPGEVHLACRYASFELNGFPVWFPKLFERHPSIVTDFLVREVRYELGIENSLHDTHYILSDIECSGQWAWQAVAPAFVVMLKREPKNLANLDRLLNVIQSADIPDNTISALAQRKCKTLREPSHLARWFAVWVGVSPAAAISALSATLAALSSSAVQTEFAIHFMTRLAGGRWGSRSEVRSSFRTPEYLKTLYLLMHQYIRREDDINRAGGGVYSPTSRDDAQDARDRLFSAITEIPGKASFIALKELALLHPEEAHRPWMLRWAILRAEKDGDGDPWTAQQVVEFCNTFERTPNTPKELFELAVYRLLDLKDDLEHGDTSLAGLWLRIDEETEMRNVIGHFLDEKALARYIIPQEEELADAKRPDLRFRAQTFDGSVPVELKLAEKWTGAKLYERLENQLCGDYLRDQRSRRGIYLLVYRGKGKKGWDTVVGKRRTFEALIDDLQEHWAEISLTLPEIEDVFVIGIDLSKRRAN